LRSRRVPPFRKLFAGLPTDIQRQARSSYVLFAQNHSHPRICFKQVHATRFIYSARVSLGYRAIAVREGDDLLWFWIGTHAEYDRVVANL
jgi:hypothetical protein